MEDTRIPSQESNGESDYLKGVTSLISVPQDDSSPQEFPHNSPNKSLKPTVVYNPFLNTMTVTISFPTPQLRKTTLYQQTFTEISFLGSLSIGELGSPRLPVIPIRLLLPPHTEIETIRVSAEPVPIDCDGQGINLKQNPIIPQQSFIPIGGFRPTTLSLNRTFYALDQWIPRELYKTEGIHYSHGYGIYVLNAFPVRYNPGKGELVYTQTMNYEILLKDAESMNPFYRPNEPDDQEWAASLVDNPEMIRQYPRSEFFGEKYAGGLCDPSDNNGQGYEYIVLTRNALRDFPKIPPIRYNWSDLILQKKINGLDAIQVTVEEILISPDYWNPDPLFNDTPALIREFCKDAYLDWGIQYLLIAGDADDYNPDTKIERRWMKNNEYVLTDIYWTHLDGTFNDDQDSDWGEDADVDRYSELYSGSVPCDEPQDISNWLTKNLFYERNIDEDYLNNAAFFGGLIGWEPEGDTIIEFSAIKGSHDWFGQTPHKYGSYPSWLGFQYGFETWNINHPTSRFNLSVKWSATDPDLGWMGGTSPAAIEGFRTAINNNQVTLISGIAHGTPDHSLQVVATEWESKYHNTKPFFLTDQGCYVGDMAADDGVLHSMLFHSDVELAFACIYNTGKGWGWDGSTNASSALMMKSFWDYLFDTVNNSGSTLNWQLGKAQEWARDSLAPTLDFDNQYKMWLETFQCNLLFGDPAQTLKPPTHPQHNIGVFPLTMPEHIKSRELITINATIFNDGLTNETNVTVRFLVDNQLIGHFVIPNLPSQTTVPVGVSWFSSMGTKTFIINVSLLDVIEDSLADNEKQQTILVGILNADTEELFDTIQAALDDPGTTEGHKIVVPSGRHDEHLLIFKNVTLVGSDRDTTIIDGTGSGTVITLHGTEGTCITGFTIQNGGFGVSVESSRNPIITNTKIVGHTGAGIYVTSSNATMISMNEISNNRWGLYLTSTYHNIIEKNHLHDNFMSSEVSEMSPQNSASSSYHEKMMISEYSLQRKIDGDGGLYLENTSESEIRRNTISHNDIGLLIYNSEKNFVIKNNIYNNIQGIFCGEKSSDNHIYVNNFNNTQNAFDKSSMNLWDNGYLGWGNWWSDYTGSDNFRGPGQNISGSDGIGDTPYPIPGGTSSTDRYPLMEPYSPSTKAVINLNTYEIFQGIQSAINDLDTNDGHTLLVKSGIYDENINIIKQLTLLGEERNTTIIRGTTQFQDVITLTVPHITLKNFTLRNREKYGKGIVVNSDYNVITGNIIDQDLFEDGISLNECSYNTISENTIINTDDGIDLWHSCFNNLSKNILRNLRWYAGISLAYSSNNIVNNNIIENCDTLGIICSEGSDNLVSHNLIIDCRSGGVFFTQTNNLSILNNTFQSCGISFNLYEYHCLDTITIENNTVHGRYIRFYKHIRDLAVPLNTGQIILYDCTGFTIQNLTFINVDCAVHLIQSHWNIISRNIVSHNNNGGVRLEKSSNNTIKQNRIIHNENGIGIDYHSKNNTIIDNEIAYNSLGLDAGGGHSLVYHNDFIENKRHSHSYSNLWDRGYPRGGNYWSDYTGNDLYQGPEQNITGSDGIGDIPYIVVEPDQDRYPLIHRFVLGDMNVDGRVDFGDINPFVLALTNPVLYQSTYHLLPVLHGDINQDGLLNFFDINPFVQILTGG